MDLTMDLKTAVGELQAQTQRLQLQVNTPVDQITDFEIMTNNKK